MPGRAALIIATVALVASHAKAADPSAEALAFFEKKIRPVLVEKCYGCHSDEAKKGPKAGLRVDSRDGLRTGGDSGPAVVPGKPTQSLLVQALKGTGGQAQMPPKESLPPDVIADFERWVRAGAADPRGGGPKPFEETAIDIESGRKHWAFRPVKPSPPPPVSDPEWPRSDIDRFIRAKLDEKGLAPADDADPLTLLRRVYFDLIGLPPTPAEVSEFLADQSPNAYEKVIDRLLASPRFGERWGRHWLDVARYAESSGKEENVIYPFAWRYRDYVIASFNADKPYDLFLKEQLAGDLLPAKDSDQRAERMIATGFLAVGPKSHNTGQQLQFRLDLADEQIDAFSQAMLGLTIACARCHDHKFDPISQRDYYALAGIFTGTETFYGATAPGSRQNAPPLALPVSAKVPLGPPQTKREMDARAERIEALKKQRDDVIAQARTERQPPLALGLIVGQITALEAVQSYYDPDGTPRKLAMGVAERAFPRDSPLYIRGEPNKPGEVVRRGFPEVLSTGREPRIVRGSGRKELADWVVSKNNPLTARVMANRVWLHLFGQGIVSTPDNFGTTGRPPTHPELLDHLAARFVGNGWSVKQLIREIVTSRTYSMSSTFIAANAAIDPDNEYLWRMTPRRLDAEAIRDSLYTVSGQLNLNPPTASLLGSFEGRAQGLFRRGPGQNMFDSPYRTVYLPVVRDQVGEVLEVFDFPDPSLVAGERERTSVPSQALYLMNNPTVLLLAEKTAERLLEDYRSPTERITAGFRLAFGRPPTPAEEATAAEFVEKFKAKTARPAGRRWPTEDKAAWAAFAQSLFAAAEFRYVR